ncbi:hypothetical protein BaRGS_00029812 [Batillaria attramentaria]|uniref:FLZ-type domain-containing protein n=1 Tax=Batillaria attramentaria TaxID=370345 RepID=A0ABD0JWG7_9CAEN
MDTVPEQSKPRKLFTNGNPSQMETVRERKPFANGNFSPTETFDLIHWHFSRTLQHHGKVSGTSETTETFHERIFCSLSCRQEDLHNQGPAELTRPHNDAAIVPEANR